MTPAAPTPVAKPVAAWVSNASLEDAARRLRSAKHAVTLTHAKPDGDAIGSTLALARAMQRFGASVKCLYPGPWFSTFDSFVGATPIVRLPEGPAADAALRALAPDPDTIAIVDTGSWSQVSDTRGWLEQRRDRAVVVDHHPSGDGDIAPLRHIETKAAAAAEIVARLCCLLLDAPSAAALPAEIAEPLFLGLATDTGFFRYSSTTPATLRMAADLIEAGADHNRIYQISEQSDKPSRLRLIGRAMSGVDICSGNRLAVVALSKDDFAQTGADLEDAGGLTDILLAVQSVRACAVLTEVDGGITKVSLRSKPPTSIDPGALDVNAVARTLGGGGHVRAAGAKIKAPIADAKRRVIDAMTAGLP